MTDKTDSKEREVAEQWLRDRYGAYRGHFAWRELEEAFLAGRASLAVSAVSGPLMGQPQAMPDLSALTERGAKAWAGVDAQGLREGVASAGADCARCGGSGEVFEHSEDCDDDLCALNGDMHSCTGIVRQCACKATASPTAAGTTQAHIAAMERAWLWMENQADAQSKGGHATFDLMMLREERDALRAAIDAAASAGSEPVAWLVCTEEGDPDMVFLSQHEAQQYLEDDERPTPLYTHPSHPEGAVGGWIALPGTLPEPGVPVLLDIGTKYPIRAMWAAKHTVQAADDDADWGEYVEEDDMYYAPEGWYEWNQCEDNHWRVTETPRAWAPLPPTNPAGSGKGE